MRRLYSFFMFFALIWTYGQNNVAGYEYWFDNNYNGKVNTAVAPVAQLTVNSFVATTGLVSGIHIVNIRSWDSKGKFSSTISSFFYKSPENEITTRKVVTYEYWFDGDYANKVSQTANNQEAFTLNTNVVPSALTSGIHTFNIRFRDNTGNYSSTLSSFFYKVPENAIAARQVVTYEYWFDGDYTNKVSQTANNQETFTLNTNVVPSALTSGIHTFNIRFKDNTGNSSSTLSSFFYKVPANAIAARQVVTYEYWFDGDYVNKVSQAANNQETFTLNTNVVPSALTSGIHTFNIRFKDNTGNSSSTLSSFFYKVPENAISDRKVVTYEYWFDGDYVNKVLQTANNQETFTLNTNAFPSALANGIHTFNIRFKDNTGNFSSTLSRFFYKNQNGNLSLKNIVAYEYWFNDGYNTGVYKTITPEQIVNINTFVIPESAGLVAGNHFMNIRFKDDSGLWSSVATDAFELTPLGIEDMAKLENVILYPNPTTKMINIDLPANYDELKLELYDMYGRLLKQQSFENTKSFEFELNEAAGVYLITISSDNKQAIFRVIKK